MPWTILHPFHPQDQKTCFKQKIVKRFVIQYLRWPPPEIITKCRVVSFVVTCCAASVGTQFKGLQMVPNPFTRRCSQRFLVSNGSSLFPVFRFLLVNCCLSGRFDDCHQPLGSSVELAGLASLAAQFWPLKRYQIPRPEHPTTPHYPLRLPTMVVLMFENGFKKIGGYGKKKLFAQGIKNLKKSMFHPFGLIFGLSALYY